MPALLLPNEILSMSAQAARRLVEAGEGDCALLYLALLERGDVKKAGAALHWSDDRLAAVYGRLAELGYYISTEEKEFVAEVRGLLNEEPEYVMDAHLPALGSMGRRVYSPEELVSYFGFTQYSQEAISERHAAKAVVEKFTMAWLAGDEKAMKPYLADDFREDTRKNGTKYSPVGTPELMTIRDLPNRGEECYVTAEFWETEQDSYFRVCLDMVKQKDGWKVKSCYFGS